MKIFIQILVIIICFFSCSAIEQGIHEHYIMYYKTYYVVIDSIKPSGRLFDTYYCSAIPGRIYKFKDYKSLYSINDTIPFDFCIKEKVIIKPTHYGN